MAGLLVFLFLCAVATFCIHGIYKKKWGSEGETFLNLGTLVAIGILFRYSFPWAASIVFYQGMFLHMFHVIPIAIAVAGVAIGLKMANGGSEPFGEYRPPREALGWVYGLSGIVIAVCMWVGLNSLSVASIAQEFKFEKRKDMVEPDINAIRFTPLQVAHTEMVNSLSASQFEVLLDDTESVDLNGGFGYAGTITPQGFIPTFSSGNDGFMVFNDSAKVKEKRVKRVDQKFKVGIGMQWTDNIYRVLYNHDPWCEYSEVFPVQLDPKQPDTFVFIAPRIKYRWVFPCSFVPYEAGVVLVHADGKLEDFQTMASVREDARLKNHRLFPVSLEQRYVESQIYDQGFLSGWYRRDGKIKIPELPGDNKQPFLTKGKDGKTYYVTCTEPEGESFALFRIYYIDVFSGERTYYECDKSQTLIGPERGINYVRDIPGYKWVEEVDGKKMGDFQIIEPVYLPVHGKLYWKYTITTKQFTSVTETAVVDASNNTFQRFKDRESFERWMRTGKSEPAHTTPAPTQHAQQQPAPHAPQGNQTELQVIRHLLIEALNRLDAIEKNK